MKFAKQLFIIGAICWVGAIIEHFLPFPFPGSVISMIILFILLMTHIVKPEMISDISAFLLGNMAFFFLPVAGTLVNYLDLLKATWFPILVISVVSTICAFGAAALSIRLTMKIMRRRK